MDALIFFLIGIGIICIFVFGYRLSKKRERGFMDAAFKLGFSSSRQITKHVYDTMKKFRLFNERRITYRGSVAQGEREDVMWSVFNINVRSSSFRPQRDETPWHETIAHAQIKDHVFPAFLLRRAHLGDIIRNAFGYRDISFNSHPEFSKLYQLEGEDEQAIRELFAPHILTFFEQKNRQYMESVKNFGIIGFGGKMPNVEATGSEFIFSFNYTEIAPQELPGFLDEASEILRVFLNR